MVSSPECPSQCHFQATHSSCSALHSTPCSPSQLLFFLSHFPLPDHSCPISGPTLIKSGKLGGPHRGRPLVVGSQHLALTATPSWPAQFSTPAASRHCLLPTQAGPCVGDAQPRDCHSSRPARQHHASPPSSLQALHSSKCPLRQYRPIGNLCDHH